MGKMSDLIEENAAQSAQSVQAETAEQTQQSHELSTVERAELLMKQDEVIAERINNDASLDEAIDSSNSQFGPHAHPEQVQMRVAKRALMLKNGANPYPAELPITHTIEDIRKNYDGKLEAGEETDDVVALAGRVIFLRNGGGLCFVQLAAGNGTPIQGMLSKKEVGADSLKEFKQLVVLGDHLFFKGRVFAWNPGELSISPANGRLLASLYVLFQLCIRI